MGSQINDLVAMGDIDTLYELMADEDDWIDQLDAAEGTRQTRRYARPGIPDQRRTKRRQENPGNRRRDP